MAKLTYQQALEAAAQEGAIRVYRLSGAWSIAYRIKKDQVEARNVHRRGEKNWELGHKMAGYDTPKEITSGWYPVDQPHVDAEPIALEAAKKNRGYYWGLTKQCQTCKLVKSIKEFERDHTSEGGRRDWECNQCAAERRGEVSKQHKEAHHRVGDYLQRETHASKPPVESEI